jgi:hypothetical protein
MERPVDEEPRPTPAEPQPELRPDVEPQRQPQPQPDPEQPQPDGIDLMTIGLAVFFVALIAIVGAMLVLTVFV